MISYIEQETSKMRHYHRVGNTLLIIGRFKNDFTGLFKSLILCYIYFIFYV